MTGPDLPAAGVERLPERRVFGWLVFGYPVLYILGFLSKSVAGPAAIWPAHGLTFAAYLLLPFRRWPLIALCAISWDMLSRPVMYWVTVQSRASLAMTCWFALANVLTSAGPAALARAMRLFRSQDRLQLVISPLWIIALFLGSLPGALLGAATGARADGNALVAGNVGLWVMASVLTIVTLGPAVFGLMLGFSEQTPTPARSWEGWAVLGLVFALFICFAVVPWPAVDPLLQPMLFAVPLSWLALRFSRRTTNLGVVAVACGVVLYAGYGVGIYAGLANVAAWPHVIIAIDVFLVIACGGALLVNLLTLKQRVLLGELARDHEALRDYARALGAAEETARRKTAADLHDGIGQVLAATRRSPCCSTRQPRHPGRRRRACAR
jgi:signal transduction histidine kinase